MPVLGNLVSAVTFRDYQYDDGKNMADVDEPKLVAGDTDNANVAQSVTEVNAEIAAISERYITEFENNMRNQGYQDITIKHEVISTTDDYFTLKLMCYQAAGSGSEEDYYYTIDLCDRTASCFSRPFQGWCRLCDTDQQEYQKADAGTDESG